MFDTFIQTVNIVSVDDKHFSSFGWVKAKSVELEYDLSQIILLSPVQLISKILITRKACFSVFLFFFNRDLHSTFIDIMAAIILYYPMPLALDIYKFKLLPNPDSI